MWGHDASRPSMLEIPWIEWDIVQTTHPDENSIPPPSPFGYGMLKIVRNPFWNSFDRFRHTNAHFSIFGTSFREFFPEMPRNNHAADEALEIFHVGISSSMITSVISLVGRRLITTTHGYLGLAPEAVQKGDLIAIVYGCNFPVVLRTCGEMYRLVGESYVDGIMDGELMEAKERGKYPEVDLIFC